VIPEVNPRLSTNSEQRIREHCVCRGHFNPEVPMEICENPACKIWLHEECIIDDVLTTTYNKLACAVKAEKNGTELKTNGQVKKLQPWKGKFKATIKPPRNEKERTTIQIIDMRPKGKGTWSERIPCTHCRTLLE
jgi:hypothetical protein